MRKSRTISGLLLALLLTLLLAFPAAALEEPDLSRTGSITVTFDLPADLDACGTLTLTRVGQIHRENANYSFVPVDELADAGFSFADMDSADLAETVAQAVEDSGLQGVTQTVTYTPDAAAAVFQELELGVYLVTQSTPAQGYSPILPFLIGVPAPTEDGYRYEVVAQSKSEPEPEPSNPTQPTDPTDPTTPPPDLPQTGQLKWPVPVLAMAGLVCILLGLVMNKQKRGEQA